MSATSGPSANPDSQGLVRLGHVLKARWWIVVLATVVCVVVAGVLTAKATKQYTAVARLNFGQNQLVSEVGGDTTVSSDPEADQETNLQVVATNKVATAVVHSLKLDMSPSEVLDEVTTGSDNDSNIVDITVVDANPSRAAKIADAFANEYVAQSRAANLAQLDAGEKQLNGQLAALPDTSANADTRTNLLQSLQKLETLGAVQSGNADITDYASVPSGPSSPKTKVNLLVAFVFGLLLGIGIAVLLNFLDRRLRGVEDFEELYGTRAIATIPWAGNEGHRAGVINSFATSEQFLILRTGLSVLKFGSEPRVVLFTSAVPGEGKTTAAVGLARAAASYGQNVIVVEADLRRPQFGSRMEILGSSPGLTPALMRNIPIDHLLDTSVKDAPRLRVIQSGPPPHNPAALLGSPEMAHLIEELADRADLVVIDAPPLLPVADADVLLDHPQIDAFIVVGRPGVTTRDDVRAMMRRLARRDLTRMGLVINGVRQVAGGDAYYGGTVTFEADGQPAEDLPPRGLAVTASDGPRAARSRSRPRNKRPRRED